MKIARFVFPLFAVMLASACENAQQGGDTDVSQPATATTESGLKYLITQKGYGRAAEAGDLVTVHYTGWLYDDSAPENRGDKFDSSVDRGDKFQFPLGAGRVIRGWDEGVAGMLIGEKRVLTIPPELGYGDRDMGVIPPGSTLIFEVELFQAESLSDS
jgi:FKBP-type peptidyl-prolyl cis-trans isomerase